MSSPAAPEPGGEPLLAPPAPASGRGARAEALRSALLLAGLLALFFAPALLGAGNFHARDNGRMHAPVKRFIAGELSRGRLPAWNPYAGMGTPLVAGGVDAVQHPFTLLLVLLPFELAFKAWVLLSFLVAALGARVWAVRLGRSEPAALLSGIAYALGGFLVSSSDNLTFLTALAAVPWLLAAAHAFVAAGGPARLAALGAASAFCAASGDPQAWMIAVGLLPLYAALVVAAPGGRLRAAGRGLLAAAAAALAAAPFVAPVVAWIPHSSRADPLSWLDRARWSLRPFRALEVVLPNLLASPPGTLVSALYETYGGNEVTSIPWVLSIYAGASVCALAAFGAARARPARLLLLAALVSLWAAMGHHAGFDRLADALPLLGRLRYWEKLAVWPGLFLAAAAAYGVDRLGEAGPATRRLALGAGAVAALSAVVALACLVAPGALAEALRRGEALDAARQLAGNLGEAATHAAAVLAALALLCHAVARGRLDGRRAALAAATLVALDLGAANVRAYTLVSPDVASAPPPLARHLAGEGGPARIVTSYILDPGRWPELTPAESAQRFGARSLAPAWNVAAGIANFDAYAGMTPVRGARFATRSGRRRALSAGLWGFRHAVATPQAARVGDLVLPEPQRVVAADPELPASLVLLPHRPRAYLAAEVVKVGRREAMEFALDPRSVESQRTVVEGEVPGAAAPPAGEARVERDEPARVDVSTTSDRRALLVLNDAYAAGWSATVDGRAAEILPANYLARGVWVEAGAHLVTFRYRTPWLREGWAAALAGALGLVLWAALRRRAH